MKRRIGCWATTCSLCQRVVLKDRSTLVCISTVCQIDYTPIKIMPTEGNTLKYELKMICNPISYNLKLLIIKFVTGTVASSLSPLSHFILFVCFVNVSFKLEIIHIHCKTLGKYRKVKSRKKSLITCCKIIHIVSFEARIIASQAHYSSVLIVHLVVRFTFV